ncbi:RHS repeat domain-containing protein, partial [Chitinophaga oryziterrae]
VNSTAVTSAFDMGHDGAAGSMVAKDVFGLALHHYGNGEYSPVNNTVSPFASVTGLTSLFDGNISAISQNLPSLGNPLLYSYSYDVLNRLKKMQASNGLNTTTNTWTPVALSDYKESISYDANGNILTYDRYGNKAMPNKQMDSLAYSYKTGTNKLEFIKDDIAAANYDNDIDNQLIGNYDYDAIGNLVKDSAGSIRNISWNVYGKISTITKTDGTTIGYTYDVTGNRVSKTVNGVQTWYVRDASGNVMSVYTKGDNTINSGAFSQTETHLYGSSRLGINTLNTNMESGVTPVTVNLTGLGSGFNINFIRGKKFFELSNHLGNVLATVSDKKNSIFTGSVFDHYEADIVSAQEYYPFGMQMPGRGLSSIKYRYGFNGQEKSDEIEGNHNTALFWEYDTRTGRRWNLDPKPTMGISEYAVLNNSPLLYSDLLGNTPGGPGDEDNPSPFRKLWNGIVYQANFFTISFKGWGAGFKATQDQLGASSLGMMDGANRALSLGLIHRSAESVGINEQNAGWYDAASTVAQYATPTPGGGGGVAPQLAMVSNSEVVAVKAATQIQTAVSLLAKATKPPAAPVQEYDVGEFKDLEKNSVSGDKLDLHHVPQAHAANQIIPGYTRATGTAVALNEKVHRLIPRLKGSYLGSARELLARDAQNMRQVAVPREVIQWIVDLAKKQHPNSYIRPPRIPKVP